MKWTDEQFEIEKHKDTFQRIEEKGIVYETEFQLELAKRKKQKSLVKELKQFLEGEKNGKSYF